MVKIDVVLPVYKGAKHLRSSIDSVLAQQNVDFTLYILDDHSPDNSWEIVNSYADSRIVSARNEKNRGLFASLNSLLKMGSAPLIKIWAQDDIMEPNCLLQFGEYFHKYNYHFAYASCNLIDDNGQPIHYNVADGTPVEISTELYRDICIFNGSISSNISNVAISRKAIDDLGYFREDFLASGDHEYWTRICLQYGAIRIPEILLSIRVHANQLSRSPSTAVAFAIEDFEVSSMLWKACHEIKKLKIAKDYYKKVILPYHFNTMLKLIFVGSYREGLRMARFISEKYSFYGIAVGFLRLKLLKFRKQWEPYREIFIKEYNER